MDNVNESTKMPSLNSLKGRTQDMPLLILAVVDFGYSNMFTETVVPFVVKGYHDRGILFLYLWELFLSGKKAVF